MASPALIIVDMQNDFVLPGAPLRVAGALETIPSIRRLLELFRAEKYPVFHIYREYRPDGSDVEKNRVNEFLYKKPFVVPGTDGCRIVDELTPMPGEYRILKNRFSAFMQTELDFILRRLGATRLVVCGTQYPNCIRATVMDGIAYGYDVTVITDATSAATPEIALANITDMKNMDVSCITLDQYIAQHTTQQINPHLEAAILP